MKIIFAFFLICGTSIYAQATSLARPAKADTCAACHGANGLSTNDLWPNLAGQKAKYLLKQLQAFQNGERKDPLMSPIAQTLTDEDVKALAEYYGGLK